MVHQQPAAAIVYKRREHVISLYVSPQDSVSRRAADSKPELENLHGYHVLHWSQANLNYWAASDLNAAELRDFADLIRQN